MRRLLLSLVLAPLCAFTAPARSEEVSPANDSTADWRMVLDSVVGANAQSGLAALDPLAAPFIACSGTACHHTWLVALDADAREDIRQLFAAVADADQERLALAQAVARIETSVGTQNGTWADEAGNRLSDTDDPDQLDCVSETINTRSYLERLIQAGLVGHHRLGQVVMRFTLILQHVASTIVDTDADVEYVIDSWVGANGEEPSVETYPQWRGHWQV
ncbi:MAG: hypothetical protein HYU59_10675 [Magnetospirillum gryphiswaldense]|nr:hypothetical protein [Magnetospirillum gryphiswaldense]